MNFYLLKASLLENIPIAIKIALVGMIILIIGVIAAKVSKNEVNILCFIGGIILIGGIVLHSVIDTIMHIEFIVRGIVIIAGIIGVGFVIQLLIKK